MNSKPVCENVLIKNKFNLKRSFKEREQETNILSHREFFEKKIELKKYKLPELKTIIKYYHLPRTGNKNILIDRITSHFNYVKHAIQIQRCFRGWIVRYSIFLRGPALNNRKICVNETDFVTLEPLDEIPREEFYSYCDKNEFVYGFNIMSLIQSIKNNGKSNNPYNREKLEVTTLRNIITLYNIIKIIFIYIIMSCE